MFDVSTIFGFTATQWLISFCLATILISVRIGLHVVYDSSLSRVDVK